MTNVSIRTIDNTDLKANHKNSFGIFDLQNHGVCIMAADSEETMQDWVLALTRVKHHLDSIDKIHEISPEVHGDISSASRFSEKLFNPDHDVLQLCPQKRSVDRGKAEEPSARHISDTDQHLRPTTAPELCQVWNLTELRSSQSSFRAAARRPQEGHKPVEEEASLDMVEKTSKVQSCVGAGNLDHEFERTPDLKSDRLGFVKEETRLLQDSLSSSRELVSSRRRETSSCGRFEKQSEALVKMGYEREVGLAVLEVCNGNLENAIMALAQRHYVHRTGQK
jgi:hypothetical protein